MVESIQTSVENYAVEQKELFALKNKENTVSASEKQTIAGDTVNISEEARVLSNEMRGDGTAQESIAEQNDEYNNAFKGENLSSTSTEESSQSTVETLQKRIKELQEELRKAQEELERVKASSEENGEDSAGSGNAEVEAAQAKVQMLNTEIAQCQAELVEAMKQSG